MLVSGCVPNSKVSSSSQQVKVVSRDINVPKSNTEGSIYGRLFIKNDGKKHPLIITSHGYNGIGNDFADDCAFYAKNDFAAFTYDFSGGSTRSQSTGKSTEMTLLTEKKDLLDVIDFVSTLDGVDSDNIFLMGGSQGGMVTALVAEELGEKIKAISLYYPAFCIPDDWRKTYPEGAEIPEQFNFWGLTLGKDFVEVARSIDVEKATGKYKNPVLIVHGTDDQIVNISYAEAAQKRYPNARLEILQGEGHGFKSEEAAKARKLVLEHMQSQL